jgi:hypothetical protein
VTCEQLKPQPKQVTPQDALSLDSGDKKNTPPNFNDRVAVKNSKHTQKTTVQHNGEFNGNEQKGGLAT